MSPLLLTICFSMDPMEVQRQLLSQHIFYHLVGTCNLFSPKATLTNIIRELQLRPHTHHGKTLFTRRYGLRFMDTAKKAARTHSQNRVNVVRIGLCRLYSPLWKHDGSVAVSVVYRGHLFLRYPHRYCEADTITPR